jgi:hypothetical protein
MELVGMDVFRQMLPGSGDAPLALFGPVVAVDTTHFGAMDYATALGFVHMALGGALDADGSS